MLMLIRRALGEGLYWRTRPSEGLYSKTIKWQSSDQMTRSQAPTWGSCYAACPLPPFLIDFKDGCEGWLRLCSCYQKKALLSFAYQALGEGLCWGQLGIGPCWLIKLGSSSTGWRPLLKKKAQWRPVLQNRRRLSEGYVDANQKKALLRMAQWRLCWC
jgi:hypothetical protein